MSALLPRLSDAEMALAEAIHRARNDLQAVVSMLRLQAAVATDRAARAALTDAAVRVLALSSLNTRLDEAIQEEKSAIDSAVFLGGLVADLRAMHFAQRPIALETKIESHRLPALQAKPLGLILNELVINALKHAFPTGSAGRISVAFHRQDNEYILTVADDGAGMVRASPARGTGLGKRLVGALTAQIGGFFEVGSGAHEGTTCIIRWPAQCPDVPQ